MCMYTYLTYKRIINWRLFVTRNTLFSKTAKFIFTIKICLRRVVSRESSKLSENQDLAIYNETGIQYIAYNKS